MTAARETLFRCTFSSPRRTTVTHVTAWDAKEAALLFADELRGEGIGEQGSIEVAAPSGAVKRRAPYRPRLAS